MSNFLDDLEKSSSPKAQDFLTELESAKPSVVSPPPKETGRLGAFGNAIYGAAKGAADLVQAPAQLGLNVANSVAQHVAPDSGVSQFLGDKTKQFNDYLTQQENQYQEETPGSIAAGAGRVAANVLPFISSGGATAPAGISKLATLAKAIGTGAGTSAISQPINGVQTDPSGQNNFLKEKSIQAGIGGAGGTLGLGLGKLLGHVINPSTSQEVKAALAEGITPTVGQMGGGITAGIENRMTSLPFISDVIKNGQRSTTVDFNRASYNRALNPIGQDATDLPVGHAGVLAVGKKLGDNYDRILSQVTFKGDAQAGDELANITKEMSNGKVTPAVADQFNNIIKNNVLSKMSPDAEMSGERFKVVLGDLSNLSKKYGSSSDPNHQILGQQLRSVQDVLKKNLIRTNPEMAKELQNNDLGYANFVRIRDAASGVGTDNGVFTPSQLASSVKKMDSSAGKGYSATGQALMQDLVKVGKNIAPTYPDSGTSGRVGELATIAALLSHPHLAIPAVAGGAAVAAPYTQMGKKLAATIMARRPESAPGVAKGLNGIAPALGAILAGGTVPLLNN